MGQSITSKLLVVHSETCTGTLGEMFEEESGLGLGDILEELGLESASPWYDSSSENWEIGVEISSPTFEDMLDQESPWWGEFNTAVDKLNKLFGEGTIRLDSFPDVY